MRSAAGKWHLANGERKEIGSVPIKKEGTPTWQ
jgi:hypothetical protein